MTTPTERAMALLERMNPVIGSYAKSGSPCGDPLGFEFWAEDYRLSELLADGGWAKARRDREVSRLMAVLVDGGAS